MGCGRDASHFALLTLGPGECGEQGNPKTRSSRRDLPMGSLIETRDQAGHAKVETTRLYVKRSRVRRGAAVGGVAGLPTV